MNLQHGSWLEHLLLFLGAWLLLACVVASILPIVLGIYGWLLRGRDEEDD